MKQQVITAMVAMAALTFAATAGAQTPAGPAGDAGAGSKKNSMCIGCHGIEGYKTAFPEVYSVPKIGGQHPAYIVKALQAYKTGDRKHPSMVGIAATLTDQDIEMICRHAETMAQIVVQMFVESRRIPG